MTIKNMNKTPFQHFLLLITLIMGFTHAAYADPKVLSVIMSNPNPTYGDLVTVTMTYCASKYNKNYLGIVVSTDPGLDTPNTGGQVFVVSSGGVDVESVNPTPDTDNNIAILGTIANGALVNDCLDCQNNGAVTVTKSYVVHIPDASNFPACNVNQLYIHAAVRDNNLGKGDWAGIPACSTGSLTWTMQVPPADFTLHKRVEGIAQEVNDLVLYSVDYNYGNGPLTITDNIPGGGALTMVDAGPASMITSSPGIGAVSGTVTWQLPDRTGLKGSSTGTVWILCKVNTLNTGQLITNTAYGNMNGSVKSASAPLVVGQPAMTLTKYQNVNSVNYGDTITYTLDYSINGSVLKAYRPFDNGLGAYSGTNPPPGFKFQPNSNGETGTWTIQDPCGNGDAYIYANIGGTGKYPGILVDDSNTYNARFCTGEIVSDFMIDPIGYEGADAQIIIRHNGSTTNPRSYGLVLSIDNNPKSSDDGVSSYVIFQKCTGGTCTYHGGTILNTAGIQGLKWFRTRIDVVKNGNNYTFSAKVWAKGDPEPSGYITTWTDVGAAVDPDFRCDGLGNYQDWRPGVNEQRGDTGATNDAYNNFMVYDPRVSTDTVLYDTVPSPITYQGASTLPDVGAAPGSTYLLWKLGTISNQSGSYTWWGVAGCGDIVNTGTLQGSAGVPVYSNQVKLSVWGGSCGTPTITRTNTPTLTFTPTATLTSTPTVTSTATPTVTFTSTSTLTVTRTVTETSTQTSTSTVTLTATPTSTLTDTPTPTDTFTVTLTCTPTSTFTPTFTPTETSTATLTSTPTVTVTPTFTITETSTFYKTDTNTQTLTITVTFTPTPTPSNTQTNTATATFTATSSATPTDTRTVTYTSTPTFTATSSATPTDTQTVTYTSTPTMTDTSTVTPTFTQTITYSSTPTRTDTMTSTNTPYPTVTSTYSDTMTSTPTYTDTPTITATATITNTARQFPYMITASIYNEAGELVARLGSIPSANHMGLVELLDMSTGAAIGVIASTQTLDVSVPGIMTPSGIGGNFSWNCVNDGGQKVSDGSYYIHVEERDLYGHTNSVTQPLTVIQVVEYTKITVFNSAGEVVREILIDKTPAPDIKLSVSDKLVLDKNKNYPIVIGYSSQGDTVNWDGQNDYGTMVSSGSYEIRIETKDLKGIVTMASKTVIILREDSGNLMEDISAYPNPLAKSSQSVMKIKWCNGGNLGEMRIRIINCAGELVKNINVRLESKIASWDLNTAGGKPAAPGIYVILLDAKSDSGYIKQNILKVSVIKGY